MQISKEHWRRSSFNRRQRFIPYLFIAPNLAIFLTFTVWPAIRGFYISFFESFDGRNFDYVGVGNYSRIFSDETVKMVAAQTAKYVFFYVLLSTTLSIAAALTINNQQFAKGLFRAAIFLPVLLSPVVVGLIWENMLERKIGLVNLMINALGGGNPGWLVENNLALISVIFVGVWTHLGFYSIIVLAGLQGIDKNLLEAASMDGATKSQLTRLIILPLLRPTTLVIVILSTIHGFQSFDFIYTLTGGGPLGATTLIVQYIYDSAFQSPIQYGLASAAAVILFLIIFSVTALNFLLGRKRDAV